MRYMRNLQTAVRTSARQRLSARRRISAAESGIMKKEALL